MKIPAGRPIVGQRASAALVFAPSLNPIGASGPPMSVFTQPGCAEFTLIFVSRNSYAKCTVNAFSAVFDAS